MVNAQEVFKIYYLYRNTAVVLGSATILFLLHVGLKRGVNRWALLSLLIAATSNLAVALHGIWMRNVVARGAYDGMLNPMVVVILGETLAAVSYLLGIGFLVFGQAVRGPGGSSDISDNACKNVTP